MVESGADIRYVGTACPKHAFLGGRPRLAGGARRQRQFRASLEQDLAALDEFKPDLAIGTTPVVQKAKERGDSGALLHQSDLGPSVDGRGWRRLARQGRQRRAGEQEPVRRHARLLRGRRRRLFGRRLAGGAARPARIQSKRRAKMAKPAAEEMGAC